VNGSANNLSEGNLFIAFRDFAICYGRRLRSEWVKNLEEMKMLTQDNDFFEALVT